MIRPFGPPGSRFARPYPEAGSQTRPAGADVTVVARMFRVETGFAGSTQME